MIKKIIFDCYGTLVDIKTKEDFNVFKKLGKKYQLDPVMIKKEFDFYLQEFSKTNEEFDYLDIFREIYPENPLNFGVDYRKFSIKKIKLYKNVKKFLKNLKIEYDLYLLSNAQRIFIINELKYLQIFDEFKDIVISSDLGIKKPNLDFFKYILDKNKLKADETIMVGNDYLCDILSAKQLGLKTLYIKTNLSPDYKNEVIKIKGFNYKKIINEINILQYSK